jgi:hypothetical protein
MMALKTYVTHVFQLDAFRDMAEGDAFSIFSLVRFAKVVRTPRTVANDSLHLRHLCGAAARRLQLAPRREFR